MRITLLTLAALPYFLFVGIDAWYHEKKRLVPVREKWLHVGTAVLLIPFFFFAFTNSINKAYIFLVPALVFMVLDETIYHRHLSSREKRIHLFAGIGLLIFLGTWAWMNSQQ